MASRGFAPAAMEGGRASSWTVSSSARVVSAGGCGGSGAAWHSAPSAMHALRAVPLEGSRISCCRMLCRCESSAAPESSDLHAWGYVIIPRNADVTPFNFV